MKPIPLLIISDAVTAPTGLARITRDIAVRVHKHLPDVFRLGTLGYGGHFSSKLGFPQYNITMTDWMIFNLPEVWDDFAGEEKGIILTIWDPSRTLWLARPQTCEDVKLRKFVEKRPYTLWGYQPLDATGPNNKLSVMLKECLLGYDRVLCYSKWAQDIVRNTLGEKESEKRHLDWLPHGIETDIFYPRHRRDSRFNFGKLAVNKPMAIPDNEWLIGIVGTNQPRKDWGLALATCAELSKEHRLRIWAHTDILDRHWSLPFLFSDFGLLGANLISLANHSDETMAKLYSACDVTLGLGRGEGFGLPIFESLACGTPCVHGNYGGAPEYMPPEFLIEPKAYFMEGGYASYRPVFEMSDWVTAVKKAVKVPRENIRLRSDLDWSNLWPRWESWFRRAAQEWSSVSQPAIGKVGAIA